MKLRELEEWEMKEVVGGQITSGDIRAVGIGVVTYLVIEGAKAIISEIKEHYNRPDPYPCDNTSCRIITEEKAHQLYRWGERNSY